GWQAVSVTASAMNSSSRRKEALISFRPNSVSLSLLTSAATYDKFKESGPRERIELVLSCMLQLLRRDLLRLELRKQDDVADAFLAQQHHAEPVDAHAHATGGGHAMLEGDQEIFIQLLLLAAGLVFEPFALGNRIVLLRVGRRDF